MKRILTIYLVFNLFFVAQSKGQGLTANDILIAKDSVHSATFDEQMGWNMKRMLMQKLMKDTSLISQDTSVARFYDTYKDDNIGLLGKIRLSVDTLYNLNATVTTAIENNSRIIKSFGDHFAPRINASATSSASTPVTPSLNVFTLSAAPDTPYTNLFSLRYSPDTSLANLAAYLDSAQTAIAMNDSLYNEMQTVFQDKASAIKTINDELSSEKIYEQNEIDANSIYLATVGMGQQVNLVNYSTQLYHIARQCILRGGPAVAYARSMYFLIGDSVWFNDEQICASPNDTCLVPLMPDLISPFAEGVCGDQRHYIIDTVPNATGYTWAVNGGAVIDSGQGTASVWISYPDTFHAALISVYATNSCGTGLVRNLYIKGHPDAPSYFHGLSEVCPYTSNVSFRIDSVPGATGYTWVVPSGCMIDSGQGTARIVVDWDDLPGDVIVVASNACGSSDSAFYYVDISTNCRVKHPANQPITSDASSGSDFKIFPNPTKGNITVVYHLLGDKGLLQLFDVTGRMMNAYQLDGKKNRFEFDIADLCCGIFEYRVIDNETVQGQGKLVIIR